MTKPRPAIDIARAIITNTIPNALDRVENFSALAEKIAAAIEAAERRGSEQMREDVALAFTNLPVVAEGNPCHADSGRSVMTEPRPAIEIAREMILEHSTTLQGPKTLVEEIAAAIEAARREGAEQMQRGCSGKLLALSREQRDQSRITMAEALDMASDEIDRLPLPGDEP